MEKPNWKYIVRLIVVVAVGISAGIWLAITASEKWEERRVSDAQLRREMFYTSEIVELETIYEETIEMESLSGGENQEDEDLLIARVIMSEAQNEPLIGKVAVARVILNRSELRGYTVEQTVYEKNQFAKPWSGEVSEECLEAVRLARENPELFPDNLWYFRAGGYHTKYGTPYTVIGAHYFSTEDKYQ